MNWKEINEKYPKAFLEWVRVYRKDKYITSAVVENFTVRLGYETSGFSYAHISRMNEQVYKFPYYFDTLGIVISFSFNDDDMDYSCRISDIERFRSFHMKPSPDRLTATIAGAEKAFEIREAQLNEAQQ